MTHHYEDRGPWIYSAPYGANQKESTPMSDIHCDADDRERSRERDRIAAEKKRKEKEEDEAVRANLVPQGPHGACPVPPASPVVPDIKYREKGSPRVSEEAQRMAPKCLNCGTALLDGGPVKNCVTEELPR